MELKITTSKNNINIVHLKMDSLNQGMSEGMKNISESVFVGLCEIMGTSQQVAGRREGTVIREMVNRRITPNDGIIQMDSGSRKEGFRLKGSDMDTMFWPNNHRVIMDMSQSEYYNTANTTLILSDSSACPPGFTILQLLTPPRYNEVQSACVRMNNRVYISSSKYREMTCTIVFSDSKLYGPVSTGIRRGVEYDHAWCFVCDFWPQSACSWIDRCHSWPDPEVVNDIVRNGCHYIPLGARGPLEDKKWKISFSKAEFKLVSSMNHSQFLTYGLLKVFFKEIIFRQSIREETCGLLSSYHVKTAILWTIQQNTLPHWNPQNLLAGFWVCFNLLLKWVYQGVCPNFFIPQNNLFNRRVHGSVQNRLFLELHELYNKGLVCLLQSSSIRSYIIDVMYNPRLSLCTEEIVMSEVDSDLELVKQCCSTDNLISDLRPLVQAIHQVEQLVDSPLSQYQAVSLRNLASAFFKNTAIIIHNIYTNTGVNKDVYTADKMSCRMLKLAAKFGCISDILYIAMYYYKTLRYREALSVIEVTKVKLAQPYLMYRGHVDREMFTEAVGGQSWSVKMRQAVAMDIKLRTIICYISELTPEQQSAEKNREPILYVPIFVMLHFLEFLCHRHIDTTLLQAALDELLVLVHCDQGLYVSEYCRDISWEILGICQQITGNLQAALYSYQQSLITQHPLHKIQTATQKRIQDVIQSVQLQ
ncbi:uncharacterized protein [Magallana gigas]|uniref:uncharacterized protein n=1 Tax=Magallana gigas TaxID=29159 RepID=UPI003340C7C4